MTHHLLAWSRRWFDAVTVAAVFEPMLADWQHELRSATTRRARILATSRGTAAFVAVILRLSPSVLFAPLPMPVVGAAAFRVAIFCAPITLLLLAPFWSLRAQGLHLSLLDWANLLPHAGVLPAPFAIILIADLAWFSSTLRQHERRRIVLQATLGLAILMTLGLGWVVPNANQAWRQAAFHAQPGAAESVAHGASLARGVRELAAFDLLRFRPLQTRELFAKALLIMLPLLLAILRWWGLMLREARRGSRIRAELSWILVGVVLIVCLSLLGYAMGLHGAFLQPTIGYSTVMLAASVAVSAICEAASQRRRIPDQQIQ